MSMTTTRAWHYYKLFCTLMVSAFLVSVMLYGVKKMLGIDFLPNAGLNTLRACVMEQMDAVMNGDSNFDTIKDEELEKIIDGSQI